MKMGARLVAVGDLHVGVWLHAGSDPPADEWSASCRNVSDFAKESGGDFTRFRAFMVTDGGTPDALQRKELFRDALREYPVRMSVITEAVATSALKRGIATAFAWMNPNFRAFGPGDLGLALDHNGLDVARFDPIWECLASLQSSLESNATMRLIGVRNRMAPSIPVPRAMSERPRSSGVLKAAKAARPDAGVPESAGRQRVTEVSQSNRARKG